MAKTEKPQTKNLLSSSAEFLQHASEEQKTAWNAEKGTMRGLVKKYVVARGDTVGKIAAEAGMPHSSLLLLNDILRDGSVEPPPLKDPTGRRIWPGEALLVPTDPVSAKTILDTIVSMGTKISSSRRARAIAAGDTRALLEEVGNETFYPASPLPLGWQDTLDAIRQQGRGYMARHARMLDIRDERDTICAQEILSTKSSAVPLRHMTPAERKFYLSKGKDAWQLSRREPLYGPIRDEAGNDLYNFNGFFDPKLVANPGKEPPIRPEDREGYRHRVLEFSRRISDPANPAVAATQVHVHYQRSGSRQKSLDASRGLPPDRADYPTHVFALVANPHPEHPDERLREAGKDFFGWEIPEIVGGKPAPFGRDTRGDDAEVARLRESLSTDLAALRSARAEIDGALDPRKNPRVNELLQARRRRVRQELTRNDPGQRGVGMVLDPKESKKGKTVYVPDWDFVAYLESLIFSEDPKKAYGDYEAGVKRGSVEFAGKTISMKGRWKIPQEGWTWLSQTIGSESVRTVRGIDRLRANASRALAIAPFDPEIAAGVSALPEAAERAARHDAGATEIARLQAEASRLRAELSKAESADTDAEETTRLRDEIEACETELERLAQSCARERIEIVSLVARTKTGVERGAAEAFPLRRALAEKMPGAYGPDAYRTKAASTHEASLAALLAKYRKDPEKARAEYRPSPDIPESAALKEDRGFFAMAVAAAESEASLLRNLSALSQSASRGIMSGEPVAAGVSGALEQDPAVARAMAGYEAAVGALRKSESALRAKREHSEKPEESMRLSDLIANYAQSVHHLDSPFTAESRAEIMRNMPSFAHALLVRIDGKTVEYSEPKIDPATGKPVTDGSGEIVYQLKSDARMPRVRPSSRVEFFGPMMMDGIHYYQSPNPDESRKMNLRYEPWAVVMMTGKFRPTSVRVPLPESSFSPESQARFDATTPAGKLPLAGEWDIRPADLAGEKDPQKKAFGYRLRKKIAEFDGPLIESMLADARKKNPAASREGVTEELYQLQVTALQLAGFINVFGEVNEGAVKWNGMIPYYDLRTAEKRQAVRQANSDFIRRIRERRYDEARDKAVYSDIVRLQVMPGDSPAALFARLRAYVALHEGRQRLPHLALVHELPLPAQLALVRTVLVRGTRLDENEIRRLRTEEINARRRKKGLKPVEFKARGVRDDADIDAFFGFEDEDTEVDRPVSAGEVYALDISEIDRALAKLAEPAVPDRPIELPDYQRRVLERMVRSPEMRHYAGIVASVESGSPKDGPPIRRNIKLVWEMLGKSSSLGVFEQRLADVTKGWDNPSEAPSWPNRKQLQEAINQVDTDLLRQDLADIGANPAMTAVFENDVVAFTELRSLVADPTPAPKARLDRIKKLIREIVRIGEGTPDNILGYALQIPLQEYRYFDVASHMVGFLQAMGEDASAAYRPGADPAKRDRLNLTILLASNQGEGNAVLGLEQNYIARVATAAGLEGAERALGESVQSEDLKGQIKGSLDYGAEAYAEALLRLNTSLAEKSPGLSGKRRAVSDALLGHSAAVAKRHLEYVIENTDPDRRRLHLGEWLERTDAKHGLSMKDRMFAAWEGANDLERRTWFPLAQEIADPEARREYDRIWKAIGSAKIAIPHLFEPMNRDIRSEAFRFFGRMKSPAFQKDIRESAGEAAKARGDKSAPAFETSVIPTADEMNGKAADGTILPFRQDFFGYVRKAMSGMDPARPMNEEDLRKIILRTIHTPLPR